MSTILHRRHVDIAIDAQVAATEFAHAGADVQAAFLETLAFEVTRPECFGSMQCRYIADEMKPEVRHKVALMLEDLVNHLREIKFSKVNDPNSFDTDITVS